ncbi:hypothetical protein BDZ94DRAFT_1245407 [Collybia nuda]|uniref:Uncharacterized protein n=1 Tax=Collybia nuda TaxID=64659 RepID=A0A9P6CPC2_9AGAR|nr:hypothetical protein BDZ94DRAFT_1245407 [Collybia nuda]
MTCRFLVVEERICSMPVLSVSCIKFKFRIILDPGSLLDVVVSVGTRQRTSVHLELLLLTGFREEIFKDTEECHERKMGESRELLQSSQ